MHAPGVGVTVVTSGSTFRGKCKEARRFHRRTRYVSVLKIQPMLRSSNFNELVGRTPCGRSKASFGLVLLGTFNSHTSADTLES